MNLSVGPADAERLRKWVEGLSECTVCVAMHRNADPDALASALGVKEILRSLSHEKNVLLLTSEGLEQASKKLLEALAPQTEVINDNPSGCDAAVIVDTSTPQQLNKLSSLLSKPYVVVDHHEVNDLVRGADVGIHRASATSTSELVAELMMYLKVRPDPRILTLLIAGILYDTRVLRLASPETFAVMAWLTENGGDYRQALNILTLRETGRSEVIARLKGLSRTGLYRLNKEAILAVTCIGAHESAVLKALIDAGADVAVAVAKRPNATRITIRVSRSFLKRLGGEPIASNLALHFAKELGGSGGGHAGAAGALISSHVSPRQILKTIARFFARRGYNIGILEEGRWMEECE